MGFQNKECDLPAIPAGPLFDVTQLDCDIMDPTNAPSNVFHVGAPITVSIKLRQDSMLAAFGMLGGCNFDIRLFLEGFGPGADPLVVGPGLVPALMGVKVIDYPPIAFALPPMGAGVYKGILTVNFRAPGGVASPSLFHAFEEIGIIEVVAP